MYYFYCRFTFHRRRRQSSLDRFNLGRSRVTKLQPYEYVDVPSTTKPSSRILALLSKRILRRFKNEGCQRCHKPADTTVVRGNLVSYQTCPEKLSAFIVVGKISSGQFQEQTTFKVGNKFKQERSLQRAFSHGKVLIKEVARKRKIKPTFDNNQIESHGSLHQFNSDPSIGEQQRRQ